MVLQFAGYRLCRYWFNNDNALKALHVRKVCPDVLNFFEKDCRIKQHVQYMGLQGNEKDADLLYLMNMMFRIVECIMQI